MTHHKLKSWSHFYKAIESGQKKHDLRDIRDRKFAVGDICTLQEYEQFEGRYTGNELDVVITFITSRDTPCAFSSAALDRDYAILSFELLDEDSEVIVEDGHVYTTSIDE